VRFGLGHDPDAALAPAFGKYLTTSRSVAAATVQKGAGLEVTYSVRMRDPTEMPGFVTEINRVEGVQGVEMKERAG
jgi:hypothetical protein